MFYYKHIDIDDRVSQEMKDWGLENIQTSDDPVVKLDVDKFKAECPLFLEWCKWNDCEVGWLVGIKVHKHNEQPATKLPHTDYRPVDQNYGLNFPVQNCEDTHTEMYKHLTGKEIIIEDETVAGGGKSYKVFSPDSTFEEVARFTLNKPVLFDINQPHKVINNTDKTRLALSIRFIKNPYNLV